MILPTDTQFSLGSYDVIVTEINGETQRKSFTVGESVPVDLRRVVCQNLRTRKTKRAAIDNSTVLAWTTDDFGDCSTAGLKVRPGDTVRQTFIGKISERP